MTATRTAALTLIDSLQAASTSADPYGDQSDTLEGSLKAAHSETIRMLLQVEDQALKGIYRFAEIDQEINLQISKINDALPSVLQAAITEASDYVRPADLDRCAFSC